MSDDTATEMIAALRRAAELGAGYLEGVDDRPVFPRVDAASLRSALGGPLPDGPADPVAVLEELAAAAEPGLVSVAGGRYFGFVTGGEVPAALGADVLTTVWDQNAFSYVASPAAAVAEEVALGWVLETLGLPATASAAIVTGCQMAHVTCLAAARNEVLRRAGWDAATDGLFGAPPVRVVTGELCHVTVERAVRLLGLGSASIDRVPVDDRGRIDPGALAERLTGGGGPTIVVAQAGEVNTGSFDPLGPIVDAARAAGAWVHVDGAFGIWAAAAPELTHLVDGLAGADSWAFDAHKWLNVPYDSGIAVVADAEAHRSAMAGQAVYLRTDSEVRNPIDWTPDASRRARGIAVYAALRSLGRTGVADLVTRCCALARRLAAGLAALDGITVLGEVVLNQVLIRMADAETTERVLAAVQAGGVAWMGGTTWQGEPAIRLSVSSWRTTETDIDRTVAAFRDAAG